MRAGTGCCVIGLDEAALILKALTGKELSLEETVALNRTKLRMMERVGRHETVLAVREVLPEYRKVKAEEPKEIEWWEVLAL